MSRVYLVSVNDNTSHQAMTTSTRPSGARCSCGSACYGRQPKLHSGERQHDVAACGTAHSSSSPKQLDMHTRDRLDHSVGLCIPVYPYLRHSSGPGLDGTALGTGARGKSCQQGVQQGRANRSLAWANTAGVPVRADERACVPQWVLRV